MESDPYQIFLDWRSRPIQNDEGYPKNQTEFEKKHSITRKQISEFLDRPTYHDDLMAATLKWAKEQTPPLVHEVYHAAKASKSVADLERFLNLVHELKKKEPSYQQNNFFMNITEDRFQKIAERALLTPKTN